MARHMSKLNNNKNSSWDYCGNENHLSWPPRCYTCSFCKREFRCAQALGGHMNVHRRDRARLLRRQSPPTHYHSHLNLNLDPNPNPSFSSSPPPSPFASRLSLLSYNAADGSEIMRWGKGVVPNNHLKTAKSLLRVDEKLCSFMQEQEFLRLDLEIGSLVTESKQDLDLELRLGYP